MEETDWCLRMKEKGWRVSFVPDARIIHLQGASASIAKTAAKIEYYRSRYRLFTKWRGRAETVLLKIGLLLRLFGEVAVNSLLLWKRRNRERWKSYCQLLFWHLTLCPSNKGLREGRYVAKDQR